MNLSVSNIAWQAEDDETVYSLMRAYGFCGLEIAPTRIFPEGPYDRLAEARVWAAGLKDKNGFTVPSMQSIWYGRNEKIFGGDKDRGALLSYTKKAIDFAAAVGCKNLVFGCPRNRNLPENADGEIAIAFFRELGDYAAAKGTAIGMEANPPIYNTNYINDTASALELIEKVGSDGFKLNLDIGTIIENGESLSTLEGKAALINHVHISEPGLKPIKKRVLHKELLGFLEENGYDGFVSLEMGRGDDLSALEKSLEYIAGIFG